MPNQKLDSVMGELREALEGIPAQYHSEVAKSLIHDIYVISRTVALVSPKDPDSAA